MGIACDQYDNIDWHIHRLTQQQCAAPRASPSALQVANRAHLMTGELNCIRIVCIGNLARGTTDERGPKKKTRVFSCLPYKKPLHFVHMSLAMCIDFIHLIVYTFRNKRNLNDGPKMRSQSPDQREMIEMECRGKNGAKNRRIYSFTDISSCRHLSLVHTKRSFGRVCDTWVDDNQSNWFALESLGREKSAKSLAKTSLTNFCFCFWALAIIPGGRARRLKSIGIHERIVHENVR